MDPIGKESIEARRVAGIHTWHDAGRHIKPGEKGILIFAPITDKPPVCSQAPSTHEPLEWGAGSRADYVFDVSQTKGGPLPEFARPTVDSKRYKEQLKTLIAEPSPKRHTFVARLIGGCFFFLSDEAGACG